MLQIHRMLMKASSDHLVRSWGHTYGLATLIGKCSNNYGEYQYPEKFIPRMILNATRGERLPIFAMVKIS